MIKELENKVEITPIKNNDELTALVAELSDKSVDVNMLEYQWEVKYTVKTLIGPKDISIDLPGENNNIIHLDKYSLDDDSITIGCKISYDDNAIKPRTRNIDVVNESYVKGLEKRIEELELMFDRIKMTKQTSARRTVELLWRS